MHNVAPLTQSPPTQPTLPASGPQSWLLRSWAESPALLQSILRTSRCSDVGCSTLPCRASSSGSRYMAQFEPPLKQPRGAVSEETPDTSHPPSSPCSCRFDLKGTGDPAVSLAEGPRRFMPWNGPRGGTECHLVATSRPPPQRTCPAKEDRRTLQHCQYCYPAVGRVRMRSCSGSLCLRHLPASSGCEAAPHLGPR